MSSTELAAVVGTVFVAGALHGASGFGFGIVSMGLLSLVFTVKDAVILVVALSTVTCAATLWRHTHQIDWRLIAPIVVSSTVGRLAAFPIAHYYGDVHLAKLALGVVLTALGVRLFWRTYRPRQPSNVKLTLLSLLTVGFCAGAMGGIFGMGGVLYSVLFLSVGMEPHSFRASMQAIFFVPNALTLSLHGVAGDIDPMITVALAVGAIATWIGSRAGVFATRNLAGPQMERVVCFVILLAGVNLIART